MGEKDISEKLLEDYNDVFADIVNVLLFGGERLVRETELVNLKNRSQYKADGALHEQEEVASMRTFLDDAWDEGLEQGLMEHLIRQVYKKMLRGQDLAQIAMETEEEEETVQEIYDVINRSLPEFDVKKVYLELKKKKMATV